MDHLNYHPEGNFYSARRNSFYLESKSNLQEAPPGTILEHYAVSCDAEHALHLELPCGRALIPREECALGISEGTTKEIAILSRVGKPVSFIVLDAGHDPILLSRRAAQEQTRARILRELRTGDILYAGVTHIEPFGIFVDIGSGLPSFIGIENLSISRISHPKERFYAGQSIFAVVTGIDQNSGRISLSHKELLGSWLQNAERFHAGETVRGIVRSIEPYGIFIELTPNLSPLADPKSGLMRGDHVSVHIRSIIPSKMKVKLNIIDRIVPHPKLPPFRYYLPEDHHMRYWQYSPPQCPEKQISTCFET